MKSERGAQFRPRGGHAPASRRRGLNCHVSAATAISNSVNNKYSVAVSHDASWCQSPFIQSADSSATSASFAVFISDPLERRSASLIMGSTADRGLCKIDHSIQPKQINPRRYLGWDFVCVGGTFSSLIRCSRSHQDELSESGDVPEIEAPAPSPPRLWLGLLVLVDTSWSENVVLCVRRPTIRAHPRSEWRAS